MKKLYIPLIIIVLLGLFACSDPNSPAYVNDDPPIDVAVQFQDTTGTNHQVSWYDGMPLFGAQNYYDLISEGYITNHFDIYKQGRNEDVGTTEETIWYTGGSYVFPTAAQQMELVSSSVQDDVGGTGVSEVTISYLDNSYDVHRETITLDGTNPVTTVANDILRVNYMFSETVGTAGSAVGKIDIRNLADTPIYRSIPPGYNLDQDLVITVPNGFTFFITSVGIASGYGTVVNKLVQWDGLANWNVSIDSATDYFMSWFSGMTQDSNMIRPFEMPVRFPETIDIVMDAFSDSANSICNVDIRGWYEVN